MLDVGGLSGIHGLFDALCLIQQLRAAFAPELRAIVIKSTCVRAAAQQLRAVRGSLLDSSAARQAKASAINPPPD